MLSKDINRLSIAMFATVQSILCYTFETVRVYFPMETFVPSPGVER